MTTYKVGYIVGSLATASINRKLAKALIRLAPPDLEFTEVPIKDLPLYSYDYDADFPAAGRALKDALASVDAVLFVTPEYNRSIPGALKNAIDWASRPAGQNSFTGKPSAVIGASPGKLGTALAQQTLRPVLGYCNSPQMTTPEAYINLTPGVVTDDGQVTDASTARFLRKFMAEFDNFIARELVAANADTLGRGSGRARGPGSRCRPGQGFGSGRVPRTRCRPGCSRSLWRRIAGARTSSRASTRR
jgi:NAD(P)H-dependent FMN reductase